jgi:hypothetical protein
MGDFSTGSRDGFGFNVATCEQRGAGVPLDLIENPPHGAG